MSNPPKPAELAGRRRHLGASRETMAAGLGLPVDEVKAIEDGVGSDQQCAHYSAWLDRVEAWPADERNLQFLAAGKGRRFEVAGS